MVLLLPLLCLPVCLKHHLRVPPEHPLHLPQLCMLSQQGQAKQLASNSQTYLPPRATLRSSWVQEDRGRSSKAR